MPQETLKVSLAVDLYQRSFVIASDLRKRDRVEMIRRVGSAFPLTESAMTAYGCGGVSSRCGICRYRAQRRHLTGSAASP
jgi:hypothetical protein